MSLAAAGRHLRAERRVAGVPHLRGHYGAGAAAVHPGLVASDENTGCGRGACRTCRRPDRGCHATPGGGSTPGRGAGAGPPSCAPGRLTRFAPTSTPSTPVASISSSLASSSFMPPTDGFDELALTSRRRRSAAGRRTSGSPRRSPGAPVGGTGRAHARRRPGTRNPIGCGDPAAGRSRGGPEQASEKGSLGVSRLDGKEDEIRRFLELGVSKTAIAKLTERVPDRPVQLHEHQRTQATALACISARMLSVSFHHRCRRRHDGRRRRAETCSTPTPTRESARDAGVREVQRVHAVGFNGAYYYVRLRLRLEDGSCRPLGPACVSDASGRGC